MKTIPLEYLQGYLAHKLKVQWIREDDKEIIISELNISDYNFLIKSNNAKPLLIPLSQFTKEIEHNGEKFVPYKWLKENYLSYGIYDYKWFKNKTNLANIKILPYDIIQKLYEWHFDIHGLIEKNLAIDINTI